MKERRKYERFHLELPARMEMNSSGEAKVLEFKTRDISAAGAFLLSAERFLIGKKCLLEVNISSNKIKELTGAQSLIKIEGKIVRSTPEGVAICFEGECQILCLKES